MGPNNNTMKIETQYTANKMTQDINVTTN